MTIIRWVRGFHVVGHHGILCKQELQAPEIVRHKDRRLSGLLADAPADQTSIFDQFRPSMRAKVASLGEGKSALGCATACKNEARAPPQSGSLHPSERSRRHCPSERRSHQRVEPATDKGTPLLAGEVASTSRSLQTEQHPHQLRRTNGHWRA